jgi:hypothetical protein
MKITIATLANFRPDFIALQNDSIKRFVTDKDVEHVVFNTAYDDSTRFQEIENACRTLGIRMISVKKPSLLRRLINRHNVSRIVASSLTDIWSNHLSQEKGIVVIIDSDMFFVRSISIEAFMRGKNMCFVPKYHGSDLAYLSPWTGLMFFDMDTLPEPETLTWSTGSIHGMKVDVGGLNYYYLERNKEKLRTQYIEMWNLEDIERQTDGTTTLKCSLNGIIRFVITLDKNNEMLTLETKDAFLSEKRSFPYQNERNDYYANLIKTFLRFEIMLNYSKHRKIRSKKALSFTTNLEVIGSLSTHRNIIRKRPPK